MLSRMTEVWRRWGGLVAPAGLLVAGALLVAFQPHRGAPPLAPRALTRFLEILFAASFALEIVWVMLRAGLTKASSVFWMVLMAFAVWYAAGTIFWERSYDPWGHEDYVRIIVERHALPQPADCWVCYHPPLYYLSAAPFYRVLRAMPGARTGKGLQYFSVALFGLFLIFYLKTVELCLRTESARTMAIMALAALPATLIHSARLGNDALLYVFWMGAIFHGIRWETQFQRRDLLIAAAYLGLGLCTKASGAVPIAALTATLAMAYGSFPERRRDIRRQSAQAFVILATAGLAYALWSRHYILHGVTANLEGLGDDLKITQTAVSQVAFSVRAFLMEFAENRSGLGHRDYFWNYFLKSSLFGEWDYPVPGARTAMRILSATYLATLLCFASMLARSLKGRLRLPWMILGTILLSPLFSLAYRWQGGYSCMGDARYVYPMFAAAAVAYAWMLERFHLESQRSAYNAGLWILSAYIAAGILFETVIFLSLTY
jgi:hypothetical protein